VTPLRPDTARPGAAQDAIAGVVPRAVYAPATVEEAAEVVRATGTDGLRLAFVGGGTDLGLGAPPAALDAVVRTSGLARIVEYAPADQIVVAEAGVTLAALQAVLARERQRLALDPPWPDRATLGGIVAANAFGPLRTRYGAARDLLIGATLVRADGTIARSGGKVVKNVAGFDLARLMVGSLGTLGMLAVVAFRLHPVPEIRETVQITGLAPRAAWEAARAVRDARLEPAAAVALGARGRLDLGFAFEGFEAGCVAQAGRAVDVLGKLGAAARLSAEEGRAFWARHDADRIAGAFAVRLSALPSALAAVADGLAPLEAALDGARMILHPLLGVGFLAGAPGNAAALPAALDRSRAALVRAGGALTVARCPDALRPGIDAWGPSPPAIALMRRLKERLDPHARLSPGRFVGGI
jgi:glycolate dehydrogenase FAD-binding subunit